MTFCGSFDDTLVILLVCNNFDTCVVCLGWLGSGLLKVLGFWAGILSD